MSFLERVAQRAAGAPPAAPARPADGGLLSGPQALRAAAPEVEEEETEVQRATAAPDAEEPEAQRAVRRAAEETADEEVQRTAADEEEEAQRAPAPDAAEEEEEVQRMAALRPEQGMAPPPRQTVSPAVRRAEASEQEEEEVQRAAADRQEEETLQRAAAPEESEEETLQRAAAAPVVEMPPEEDPPKAAQRAPLAEGSRQTAAPMPRLSAPLAFGQDGALTYDAAESAAAAAIGQSGQPPHPESRAGGPRMPRDTQDPAASFGIGDASALVPNATLESLLAAAERDREAEALKPAAAGTASTRPQVTIERLDVFVAEPPRAPSRTSGRASGAASGPRLDTRYLRGL